MRRTENGMLGDDWVRLWFRVSRLGGLFRGYISVVRVRRGLFRGYIDGVWDFGGRVTMRRWVRILDGSEVSGKGGSRESYSLRVVHPSIMRGGGGLN